MIESWKLEALTESVGVVLWRRKAKGLLYKIKSNTRERSSIENRDPPELFKEHCTTIHRADPKTANSKLEISCQSHRSLNVSMPSCVNLCTCYRSPALTARQAFKPTTHWRIDSDALYSTAHSNWSLKEVFLVLEKRRPLRGVVNTRVACPMSRNRNWGVTPHLNVTSTAEWAFSCFGRKLEYLIRGSVMRCAMFGWWFKAGFGRNGSRAEAWRIMRTWSVAIRGNFSEDVTVICIFQ